MSPAIHIKSIQPQNSKGDQCARTKKICGLGRQIINKFHIQHDCMTNCITINIFTLEVKVGPVVSCIHFEMRCCYRIQEEFVVCLTLLPQIRAMMLVVNGWQSSLIFYCYRLDAWHNLLQKFPPSWTHVVDWLLSSQRHSKCAYTRLFVVCLYFVHPKSTICSIALIQSISKQTLPLGVVKLSKFSIYWIMNMFAKT